jgi:hypothetical protein
MVVIQVKGGEEKQMDLNGSKKGKGRGFAGMDPAKQRSIASKGGRAAHRKGTAHEFTSEEGRAAGSKGGRARAQRRSTSMSEDNTVF